MRTNNILLGALVSIVGLAAALPTAPRDLTSGAGAPKEAPANLESRKWEPPKPCESDDECEAPLICGVAVTFSATPLTVCRERQYWDD